MAPFTLPPAADANRLAFELRMTGDGDRADAAQEAWLAHLQGRDPAVAVNTFNKRERRHRARQLQRSALLSTASTKHP